jgi:hypothetical protein
MFNNIDPQDRADIQEFADKNNVKVSFHEFMDDVIIQAGAGVGSPREKVLIKHYQHYTLYLNFKHIVGKGEYSYTIQRKPN